MSQTVTSSSSGAEEEIFSAKKTLHHRSGFESTVLCLHYYSNALGFDFGDQEEVYKVDQIKEWAQFEDPIWLDNLKDQLFKIAGNFIYLCV
jgi:hypothetical protein